MGTKNAASTDADILEVRLFEAATEYQQHYYEICSDWNLYKKDEHAYLKDFIGYALFGPPNFQEQDNENKHDFNHFVYTDKEQPIIDLIYQKVVKYGINEQNDGVLFCGIIYIVIYNKEEAAKAFACTEGKEKKKNNDKSEDVAEGGELMAVERQLQVYPVPLFKVRAYRKVTKKKNGKKDTTENTEKTCYVDAGGRVYDGFADYLENNTLPMCTMVLPKDGRYQGDPGISYNDNIADTVITKVWLEVHQSPVCGMKAKLLAGADIANTVVTVASMGVGIVALVTPIGAGVAIAGTVGAGVSSLWTMGRGAQQLADRGQHGESITDRNAIGAWIGIAGGTMGLASAGGAALLTRAVRTGSTVGRAATIAYDAVQIGNLIVNGVGIGFKGYDIFAAFYDGGVENISATDVMFLTAHVFFFCNSVMNVRLARSMIESTQGQLMKDYEASLRSNRHRKEYQRMVRNTRAAGTSDISTNEEIIRAINKIDNKDEFFQSMVRIRKTLSASGAKASFSTDGRVTVNGAMTIDPIEFASLHKDIRANIVKDLTSVQLSNAPTLKSSIPATGVNEVSYKKFTANSNSALKDFYLKHSYAMLQGAPPKISDFANVLGDLQHVKNRLEIFVKLLEAAYKICLALPNNEPITAGEVLALVVQFLWDYVKTNLKELQPGMFIEDPSMQLLLNKLMLTLLRRVEEKLDEWVEAFTQWLKTQFPQVINKPFLKQHKYH